MLRSLGYRASLHTISIGLISQPMWAKFQISVEGDWVPHYPPVCLLPPFFACNGGSSNGYYCNPAIDQEMTEATLLKFRARRKRPPCGPRSTTSSPTRRNGWRQSTSMKWTSSQVALRNYEFNPVNGFVADQAVVRR